MDATVDTIERSQLRKWISGNKHIKFELLYKATRDGCSASLFHKHCDNKGPTVTIAQNTAGYLFGGYTTKNWTSVGGAYSPDHLAFLFTLRKTPGGPKKWNIKPGGNNAIYNHQNHGPTFGSNHDLYLINGTPSKSENYWSAPGISVGGAYDFQNDDNSVFCGANTYIVEIEVYSASESELLAEDHQWRKIEGWNDKTRAKLIQELSHYKPFEELGVPDCRILLLGQVGAGKSSFFNTVNSVFRSYVTAQAGAGSAQHSLTTMFRAYSIRTSQGGPPLQFKLCDSMGLEEDQGLNAADVGYLLDGHVPDRFQFNPVVRISPESPGFRSKTTLSSRIHCVAFVIDASTADVFSSKVLERLLSIKEVISQRGVPMVVLLTKIDQVCQETTRDVSMVFRSEAVHDALDEVAARMGLPRNHILPVKNYESESELVTGNDILTLVAIRQMLRFADGYFDEQYDRVTSEDTSAELESKLQQVNVAKSD